MVGERNLSSFTFIASAFGVRLDGLPPAYWFCALCKAPPSGVNNILGMWSAKTKRGRIVRSITGGVGVELYSCFRLLHLSLSAQVSAATIQSVVARSDGWFPRIVASTWDQWSKFCAGGGMFGYNLMSKSSSNIDTLESIYQCFQYGLFHGGAVRMMWLYWDGCCRHIARGFPTSTHDFVIGRFNLYGERHTSCILWIAKKV